MGAKRPSVCARSVIQPVGCRSLPSSSVCVGDVIEMTQLSGVGHSRKDDLVFLDRALSGVYV